MYSNCVKFTYVFIVVTVFYHNYSFVFLVLEQGRTMNCGSLNFKFDLKQKSLKIFEQWNYCFSYNKIFDY